MSLSCWAKVLIIKSAKQRIQSDLINFIKALPHVLFLWCAMFPILSHRGHMYLEERLAVGNCSRTLSADDNRHMETIAGKRCGRAGHAERLWQRVPWLLAEDGVHQLDYLILRWMKKSSSFSSIAKTRAVGRVISSRDVSSTSFSGGSMSTWSHRAYAEDTNSAVASRPSSNWRYTPPRSSKRAARSYDIREKYRNLSCLQLAGLCWVDTLNHLTSISSRISPSSACWERRDAVCRARMILRRGTKEPPEPTKQIVRNDFVMGTHAKTWSSLEMRAFRALTASCEARGSPRELRALTDWWIWDAVESSLTAASSKSRVSFDTGIWHVTTQKNS